VKKFPFFFLPLGSMEDQMSEKIKIVLKPKAEITQQPTQIIQHEKIKLKPKSETLSPTVINQSSHSTLDQDSDAYLRDYFINPLKKLIRDEGVYNGVLIAQIEALEIMQRMFDSLLIRDKTTIVDILNEAAFAGSEECLEIEEEISEEIDDDDEEENDDDDEDENEGEIKDEEEDYDYEYDVEEAKEFDCYAEYEEDESMDG
jgi:hypothetical protein